MLDPLFALVVVTICTVLVLLFASLQKKGFDEVWNEETKKLLNGQQEKNKPKEKKEKRNKTDKEKRDRQKDKEINLAMVQARLAALPDLEPEYISFIQEHLNKFDQQIKDLSELVAQLDVEKATAEKLAESLKAGRAVSESKIAELKNANMELNGKMSKLNSAQADWTAKLKKAEMDRQTAQAGQSQAREESRELRQQVATLSKEMQDVEAKAAKKQKEAEEKARRLEEAAHLHHVDLTALREKNEELYQQALYLERAAGEKDCELRRKDQERQAAEEESTRLKEDERQLVREVEETRQLMTKIAEELSGLEVNNDRLQEHRQQAEEENDRLAERNEELVVANLELTARCETLEKDLTKKLAEEVEKERQLAELNANQEKLIRQLQQNPTREELEFVQQENKELVDHLASLELRLSSPKSPRVPPPSPEMNLRMAGDSQQALLKLQQELALLEKQSRQKQRQQISDMLKSLEDAQRSTTEESLARQQAQLETIDSIQENIQEAMVTLFEAN